MAPPTLNTLPPELLLTLVAYIPRPQDQKALCLTSKVVQQAATPALYETVAIGPKTIGYPDLNGRGLFRADNHGLAYVRRLEVEAESAETSSKDCHLFKLALQLLPRNALIEVDTGTVELDETALTLLCTQQRCIQELRIGPLDCTFAALMDSHLLPSDWLQNVRDLELPYALADENNLVAYRKMLELSPNLQCLTIKCHRILRNVRLPTNFWDTASSDGALLSKVFQPLHVNVATKLQSLQGINLVHQRLGYAERSFLRVIDVSKLNRLVIEYCENSDHLLALVAEAFRKSGTHLRNFTYRVSSFDPTVLESFLGSFNGLRRLYIAADSNTQSFDFSSVTGHSSSVQQLAVLNHEELQGFSPDVNGRAESIEKLCGKCKALKQLALVFPSIKIDQGDWQAMGSALDALRHLPEVKTVRILNWPEVHREFFSSYEGELIDTLERTAYLSELDVFATALMRKLESIREGRDLPIVCFGDDKIRMASDVDGFMTLLDPTCYVGVKQIGVFGRSETVAVRMSLAQARYVEPEHNILFET